MRGMTLIVNAVIASERRWSAAAPLALRVTQLRNNYNDNINIFVGARTDRAPTAEQATPIGN